MSAATAPDPQDVASDDDRRWFSDHPGRDYRLRRSFPGEARLHPDWLTTILVKQMAPGIRIRVQILADRPPPGEDVPDIVGDEIVAEKIATDPWFADLHQRLAAIADARA
jgi:hypothetical protein